MNLFRIIFLDKIMDALYETKQTDSDINNALSPRVDTYLK